MMKHLKCYTTITGHPQGADIHVYVYYYFMPLFLKIRENEICDCLCPRSQNNFNLLFSIFVCVTGLAKWIK